jgi:lysozyme family protein
MNERIFGIIDSVLSRERGYVNNPKDLGGETNWGITKQTAKANGYEGNMFDLPRDLAFEILMRQYFIDPGFDKVHDLCPTLAEVMTDAGVLCGIRRSILWLQIALNALNREQKLYHDIEEDGSIGFRTLNSLREYLDHRKKDGEKVILRAMNCQIGAHFISISRSRPANEEFVYGWLLHRVNIA